MTKKKKGENPQEVKLTDLEMKIIKRIWALGDKASVQEVLDNWSEGETPIYTTVLKTLQIMEKKGLVGHQRDGRAYKYYPLFTQEKASQSQMKSLLSNLFGNNKIAFANRFISDSDLDRNEIDEMKRMLEEKEKELKNNGGE